jgi:hypothetical protein
VQVAAIRFRGLKMKSMFSLVGLLLVLAIVGVLFKRQTAPVAHPPQATGAQHNTATPSTPALPTPPSGTPQQQVDQVKKALDQAVQSRPMPDNL